MLPMCGNLYLRNLIGPNAQHTSTFILGHVGGGVALVLRNFLVTATSSCRLTTRRLGIISAADVDDVVGVYLSGWICGSIVGLFFHIGFFGLVENRLVWLVVVTIC